MFWKNQYRKEVNRTIIEFFIQKNKSVFFLCLEMEMFLYSVMSLILLVTEDKLKRPISSFSEAIVDIPEKYGPMKVRV